MCNYCGQSHAISEVCKGITRRSFCFIGGGVALGVTLAPAANYWEPYKREMSCGVVYPLLAVGVESGQPSQREI